jgi:hypoxanthine phosphoribosyltransferase
MPPIARSRDRSELRLRLQMSPSGIVAIVVPVLGVIAALIAIHQFVEERKAKRGFSWRDVERLIHKLLDSIRNDDFDPDLVLGVGRGGAIVAGIIAGNMGRLPLVCIDTESRREHGRTHCVIRFPNAVPVLRDKRVLIVVGELYSGEDLRTAMDFVARRKPAGFKTLSLLSHPASIVRPDFVGRETQSPLVAPWRLTDDYKKTRI